MTHLTFVLTLLMGAPLADEVRFERRPVKAGLIREQRDTQSNSTALQIGTGPKRMEMVEKREEANRFRARVLKADPEIRQLEVKYGERTYTMDGPFFKKKAEHPVSARTYVVTLKGKTIDVRRADTTAVTAKERAIVRRDVGGWLGVPALWRMLPDRPIAMNETLHVPAATARRFLGDLGTSEGEARARSMTLTLRTVRRVRGETRAVFAVVLAMHGEHRAGELKLRSSTTLEGEMVVAVDTTRLVRFAVKGIHAFDGAAKAPKEASGEGSVTGSGPISLRREISWQP